MARLMGTDDGSNEPEKQMDLTQKNAGCEQKYVYTDGEDKTSIQTLGFESCNGI